MPPLKTRYVAYHLTMALEENQLTDAEAKRLAGFLLLASVGGCQQSDHRLAP